MQYGSIWHTGPDTGKPSPVRKRGNNGFRVLARFLLGLIGANWRLFNYRMEKL